MVHRGTYCTCGHTMYTLKLRINRLYVIHFTFNHTVCFNVIWFTCNSWSGLHVLWMLADQIVKGRWNWIHFILLRPGILYMKFYCMSPEIYNNVILHVKFKKNLKLCTFKKNWHFTSVNNKMSLESNYIFFQWEKCCTCLGRGICEVVKVTSKGTGMSLASGCETVP